MLSPEYESKEALLNSLKKQWLVFYTKSRAEKMAFSTLLEKGYDVLLPLKKETHYYAHRQKRELELPIFPGYIFVYTTQDRIYEIEKNKHICMCIRTGSSPSKLSEKDVILIQNITKSDAEIQIDNKEMAGKKVKIISGPLKGFEGIVEKILGTTRVIILIEPINCYVSIPSRNNTFKILEH